MATTIPTVLGEVFPDDLGVTDYHEHLYVEPPTWLHQRDPDFALTRVDWSAEELRSWHAAGGKTLVDMTAPDFGRNLDAVRKIAEAVPGVNVLVTTGYNRPWYMGRWVYEVSEEDMIRQAVREATHGIGNTGIRAAVIKCGTEYNILDEAGRKLIRVAAGAHRETGRPVITHTTAGTLGDKQAELLVEGGVAPHRICLSHMDRNPDFPLHAQLAREGVYLGYDSFGKIKYGPETTRIELLRKMVEAGLGHRILIGNDLGRPSYWRAYGGGPGLDFVLTALIPRLKKEGFSSSVIDGLMIDNPRRFFAGEA